MRLSPTTEVAVTPPEVQLDMGFGHVSRTGSIAIKHDHVRVDFPLDGGLHQVSLVLDFRTRSFEVTCDGEIAPVDSHLDLVSLLHHS